MSHKNINPLSSEVQKHKIHTSQDSSYSQLTSNSVSGSACWSGQSFTKQKGCPNKKKIVWMLLVFSLFFVPTMQLCPPGMSVCGPNTVCAILPASALWRAIDLWLFPQLPGHARPPGWEPRGPAWPAVTLEEVPHPTGHQIPKQSRTCCQQSLHSPEQAHGRTIARHGTSTGTRRQDQRECYHQSQDYDISSRLREVL